MKRLTPSSTQPSPSRRALVASAPASEPAPGSVRAYAAIHSPLAHFGTYFWRCSSLPSSRIGSPPSPCTARTSPTVASAHDSSSTACRCVSMPVPVPPYSSGKARANTSFSRSSSTASHGNSAVWSTSAARGAIRSRASVRTASTSMRPSSESGVSGLVSVTRDQLLGRGGHRLEPGRREGVHVLDSDRPAAGEHELGLDRDHISLHERLVESRREDRQLVD